MNDAVRDAQRAANVRLGLVLGAIAIAIAGAMFVLFSTNGLPKDPEVVKQIEQRRSTEAGVGATSDRPANAGQEHP